MCAALPTAAYADKTVQIKSLADFDSCVREQADNESCLRGLERYVAATPKEALSAAKAVRRQFNSEVSLRFFEKALAKDAANVCGDEDLQIAVVAGLALPKDYADATRARKMFDEQCYASWKPP